MTDVAQRLRAEHGGGLVLVAVTGYSADEMRRRAREAGFDAYVTKLFEMARLEELLRTRAPRTESGETAR